MTQVPPELPEAEPAELLRELGPFPGVTDVAGVTFDGLSVWIAAGSRMIAISPESGELERSIEVPARAGSAFDGRYLYQLDDKMIQKIDPHTGKVVARVPLACEAASGMAWAEGFLWVGQYNARRVHQIDPETGAIVRTLESDRFVTGVCWVEGELWHGAMQGDQAELRELDPSDGRVLHRLALGAGLVSGLESDGRDNFFAGAGASGKLRIIRKPRKRERR